MPSIDHIGIAVLDFEAVAKALKLLGIEPHPPENVPDQKVETWSFPAGESEIELLKPTAVDSPISKYLDRKGTGIHHIALRVEDIRAEIARLQAAGIRMIDDEPRAGAGGKLIAFIHPKSTGGILIELSESAK